MYDPRDNARALSGPTAAEDVDERWIGRIFGGRYELLRLIGTGGAAALFAARDVTSEATLALKVIVPRPSETSADVERFVHEAQVARGLPHPGIVAAHDAGIERDGTAYLAMELLEGCSLAAALKPGIAAEPELVLKWLLPIMGALAFAHERGVLHRDLKPENIFLTSAGDPKLLDFGIAKTLGAQTITHSGVVVGTPAYMSPEQALGETLSVASDVWSMGVVLFQCLSGRLPFVSDSLTGLLIEIANGQAPLLATVAPHVPRRLAYAVDRALRREPAQRYVDMVSFARALHDTALRENIPLPAEPDTLGLPAFREWRHLQPRVTVQVPLVQESFEPAQREDYPVVTSYRTAGVSVLSVGNALISWTGAGVDTRAVAAALRLSERLMERYPQGIVRLVVVDAPVSMPTAAQRAELQSLAKEVAAFTLAAALVLRGGGLWMGSMRMVARAMQLAVPSPYPHQIFENATRAARWLEQVSGSRAHFSAQAVLAASQLP